MPIVKKTVITKRADFLRAAASGKKCVLPAFIIQKADAVDSGLARFGFTATKKLGNAVVRNRAKRRMRALVQAVLRPHAVAGDYVLIARQAMLARDFADLQRDAEKALKTLQCWHGCAKPSSP